MRKVVIVCLLVAAASVASATTTYVANGQTTTGETVKAKADFTFTTDLLTLTLTNLLVNPSDAGQNITDFGFTIAGLSATNATLVPYSNSTTTTTVAPQTVTISGPGFVTAGNSGKGFDPGWAFAYSSGNFALDGLTGSANGPAYSIVGAPGAGGYTNANSSLTNGAHNPMIFETATWQFQIVDPNGAVMPITHIVFSFGTTAGQDYFFCDGNGGCGDTPEPASILLMATGLGAILLLARKATHKRTA